MSYCDRPPSDPEPNGLIVPLKPPVRAIYDTSLPATRLDDFVGGLGSDSVGVRFLATDFLGGAFLTGGFGGAFLTGFGGAFATGLGAGFGAGGLIGWTTGGGGGAGGVGGSSFGGGSTIGGVSATR